MFLNYLKTAFRMMFRQKMSSIINISGLAIGLASALFIFMYIYDELQYDKYHEHRKTVFRVIGNTFRHTEYSSSQPAVLMTYLLNNIPEVERGVRFQIHSSSLVSRDDKTNTENNWVMADSCVFEMFSWPLIRGNSKKALTEPNTVVITTAMAEKYFGDEDPMGQILRHDNAVDFVVTGIMEPIPAQSHFEVNFLASMASMETMNPHLMTNWGNHGVIMFLKLHPLADPAYVSERVNEEFWLARSDGQLNSSSPDGPEMKLQLQSLEDIYLGSGDIQQLHNVFKSGNRTYLFIFSAIAILILLIACFNYMNLATARSLSRAREVGLRKVLGSHKGSLVKQFMTESFLYILLAVIVGIVLIEAFMPGFNNLTGKELSTAILFQPLFIAAILILVLIVSLIAGSYPSFVLASFEPVFTLKGASAVDNAGKVSGTKIGLNLRKSLVVIQFVISIALLISSIVISQQIYYLRNVNLGFDKEHLLSISQPWGQEMNARYESLQNALLGNPRIVAISAGHNIPGAHLNLLSGFRLSDQTDQERVMASITSVDWDYFNTIGAEFLEGRDFSREYQTDLAEATIINETAARQLGLEEPVGTKITGFWDTNEKKVIGVIRDVQHRSLHNPPQPVLYYLRGDGFAAFSRFIVLRISGDNVPQTIREIEEQWAEIVPEWPLGYTFSDEIFERHYKAETQTSRVVSIFAALAVLLSFMGLLGLVSFIVQSRIREFGIRKVLGASVLSLNMRTAREFSLLVLISAVLAWPLSWYIMDSWLNNFRGRIDISIWVLISAAIIVFLLTLAITLGVTWRAAMRNPVDAIKYE
jgi:putative ABC transport system permease protein